MTEPTDDELRKAIEDIADSPWEEATHRLWDTAGDILRKLLAREAEHTTPVSPEWLDGAEAKRLGFERFLDDEWGTPIREGVGEVRVEAGKNGGWLAAFDCYGDGGVLVRCVPTIRQVRLAVELATGRR